MKAEIPELTCEGCKARDRMIQRLAEHLDSLAKEARHVPVKIREQEGHQQEFQSWLDSWL